MANIPPDDAELEHLLTRLLRMVSPGFTTQNNALVSHSLGSADESSRSGSGFTAARATVTPLPAGNGDSVEPSPAVSDGAGVPVSASEARALIELVSARGIAQVELAGLLGLDKSTVSRLAASLERKGWVRRGRDEANQRYVRLYLTPAGGVAADRVWQAWQSRQARILASMSEDERAGLAAGLRGLIRGLSTVPGPEGDSGSAARQTTGFR